MQRRGSHRWCLRHRVIGPIEEPAGGSPGSHWYESAPWGERDAARTSSANKSDIVLQEESDNLARLDWVGLLGCSRRRHIFTFIDSLAFRSEFLYGHRTGDRSLCSGGCFEEIIEVIDIVGQREI